MEHLAAFQPKAILFDYDDTLVRTRQCKFAAVKALASRSYAFQLTDEAIARHWGIPYRALFAALFSDVDADLDRVLQRYESLADEFPLDAHAEALQVLQTLAARLPVGILTSAGRDVARSQLLGLGVDPDRLVVFQTADDTTVHKPDPAVFAPALLVLSQLGIAPGDVLYVGDSLRDLAAARGAGLAFVGVLRGTTTAAEFAANRTAHLNDLTPLLSLLAPSTKV